MELREILAPLLRWWWLIVAAVAVAVVSSLFTGLQQPPIYQSATTVMIGRAIDNPNPDYMQFYASQQLATTYAEIASRDIVRRGTMQALGLDWLPVYTVQPVPNTQLLEISVTDTDPVRASVVANEVANQLILQSPTARSEDSERQKFIGQQLDDLEKKINSTQSDIDTKQQELTNLTSARQISDMQNQIYTLQAKLDTLRSNYSSLLYNTNQGALNSLTVIEPASVPANPIGPNVLLMVITAAALAGVLAVGATYLLAYLDNTIKSPEEIRKLTNLPMLVGIPLISGEQYSDKLITAKQPRSPVAEAYRSLRTAVQFSTIDRIGSTAILMTSANPSEGKSITTANLAVVLAQAGHRVLMIDADLRRPVMHRIFGVDNRLGLSEFLRNVKIQEIDESVDQLLPQLVRSTSVENLWALTSGPLPPNPSEILGSNSFHQLLATLKHRYDYLIIDSPPVLVVTDAVVLSSQVEGVVLVIDAETTPKNQLKQASEKLTDVNAPLLGVVVNRLSQKTNGFSTYSTYYRKYGDTGYGYANTEVPPSTNGKGFASSIKNILKGFSRPKT